MFPGLIKRYYRIDVMVLSFSTPPFIPLPITLCFHNAVGKTICRDYVKCCTRRRERIMCISVNICTVGFQRVISLAILLFISLFLFRMCVGTICISRAQNICQLDDKAAFHRAEPLRYISAFQALKVITLISRGRRCDVE